MIPFSGLPIFCSIVFKRKKLLSEKSKYKIAISLRVADNYNPFESSYCRFSESY